ncbi:MAG: Secreted effector protein PipB [Syntrophus sp. PtaU1.Bin208]|nr:MAG: Secreted effector protein PipB [Syntrophus sp. PtaU1.Bin208]
MNRKTDGSTFPSKIIEDKRRLDLDEQVLLAKPASPETLALIRSEESQKALTQIEPINLQGRNLRHARMYKATLTGADLRVADLQGADLIEAALQGADLIEAALQGADLSKAALQGANLSYANLYASEMSESKTELIDARNLGWMPIDKDGLAKLIADSKKWIIRDDPIMRTQRLNNVLDRLKKASLRGAARLNMQSCLAFSDDETIRCEKRYDPAKPADIKNFKRQLHSFLGNLACQSPSVARNIIWQIPGESETGSSREGLELELRERLKDKKCTGLQELSAEEKKYLLELNSPLHGKE